MTTERRVHPRVVVSSSAEMWRSGAESPEQVQLHEISAGGAGFNSRIPVPVQEEVRLRFRLPGEQEELEVNGLIVYSGRQSKDYPGQPHRAGVLFLDLHGERFDRVQAWVWSRLQPDPVG